MALADFLPVASEVPQFIAGLLLLVIAVVAVVLRFSSRVVRAFALYLVLYGMTNVLQALDNTPSLQDLLRRVWPYFLLPLPFSLLYLLGRYREREFGVRLPKWQSATLLVLALGALTAYVIDHDLFGTQLGGPSGPLRILWGLALLVPATGAWLFGRTALRRRETAARRGGLLAALAFGLYAAFLGTLALVELAAMLFGRTVGGVGLGWLGAGAADEFSLVRTAILAASVVPVAALTLLLLRASRDRSLAEILLVRRGAGALLLATGSGAFLGFWPLFTSGPIGAAGDLVDGLWALALPGFLGYAIFRHGFFELDVKIKRTLGHSIVAGAFVATFFAVGEMAQILFTDAAGPYVGIAAAAALVFAFQPLHRLATRVSAAALPGVKPTAEMSRGERLALFREQAEAAWADRQLGVKERRMLDLSRARLSLTADEALLIEGEAAAASSNRRE